MPPEAIAAVLASPGVLLLLYAIIGVLLVTLGCALLVLSSDRLSRNAARIGRAWRGKK